MTDSSADKMEGNNSTASNREKSIFRSGLLSILGIIFLVIIIYGTFFLDNHLKYIFEFSATRLMGAEVNVHNLDLNFTAGKLNLEKIQFTDPNNPRENAIQIENGKINLLWDGLLRAKFVVEEMEINNVRFDTSREKPGLIIQKEEKEPGSGTFAWLYGLVSPSIEQTASRAASGTVLGDIARIHSTTSADKPLQKYKEKLQSFAVINKLENENKKAQAQWKNIQKKLPGEEEQQTLKKRINQLKDRKYKNKKQLKKGLQKLSSLKEKIDSNIQIVNRSSTRLQKTYEQLREKMNELPETVVSDREFLNSQFQVQNTSFEEFGKKVFGNIIQNRLSWFDSARKMTDKYMTSPGAKNDPLPKKRERALGIDFKFPTKKAYPSFWIKSGKISFQGKENTLAEGKITNLSTYPPAVAEPAKISISGDFPGKNIEDLFLEIVLDRRRREVNDQFELRVGNYKIRDLTLVNSSELNWQIREANTRLDFSATRKQELTADLKIELGNLQHRVDSKKENIESLFQPAITGVEKIKIRAQGKQQQGEMNWTISSDLGSQLSEKLNQQIRQKMAEAREEVLAEFDKIISSSRSKLEAEISDYKKNYESKLKKLENKMDELKTNSRMELEDKLKDEAQEKLKNKAKEQFEKLDL